MNPFPLCFSRKKALTGVVLLWALPAGAANITGFWANNGEDKVTRDELRVARQTENLTGHVINRTWDGRTINLFGAQNEVVSFNLVLEAAGDTANAVSIFFDTLS